MPNINQSCFIYNNTSKGLDYTVVFGCVLGVYKFIVMEHDEELYAQYFIQGLSNIKCPRHILDVDTDSCAKCGQHLG